MDLREESEEYKNYPKVIFISSKKFASNCEN